MKPLVYKLNYLLVIYIAFINNAMALTTNYQTPLEQAQWQFSGDVFGCVITHNVQSFGSLSLTAQPGEPLALTLAADWLSMNNAHSQASVVPPAWKNHTSQRLATTSLKWQGSQASSKQSIAPFLEALEQGLKWEVSINSPDGSQYRIDSTPVSTRAVANNFRLCRQKLLPKPFSYVRRLDLLFDTSSSHLNTAHSKDLAAVSRYIEADSTIAEVLIDGHADASGNRIANLVLSKERADEVASMLIELGVPAKMIQVRHHGTRAPIAANNNQQGRELNRRVSIRLVKTSAQSASSATAGASQ